jgi:hypothetical protein
VKDDELKNLFGIANSDQQTEAIANFIGVLALVRQQALSQGFSNAQAFELARTFLAESVRGMTQGGSK